MTARIGSRQGRASLDLVPAERGLAFVPPRDQPSLDLAWRHRHPRGR
jgi:hypothetical protein